MSEKKTRNKRVADEPVTDKPELHVLTESESPVPNGTLLLVGGAEDKGQPIEEGDPKTRLANYLALDVMKTFVDLTKKETPRIEVICTASGQPQGTEEDYRGVFGKLGCTNVGYINDIDRLTVHNSPYFERLKTADAVYFAGGDQLKLTSFYGGTLFLAILKQRYVYDELVVGGTSAGAMAMSTPMIYQSSSDADFLKGEVKITTGLEFLQNVAVDTHFISRGRFVRLAQVVATNPSCLAMGIEEDTGVIIRNGREAEVVGNGAIVVIDGHTSKHTNISHIKQDQAVSIDNLTVHILVKGDRYILPQYNLQHQ